MNTLQLDLDVILPHATDARDACVDRLVSALGRVDGVESVHLVSANSDTTTPAQVCLHLASGSVSIERLEQRSRSVGAQIESRFGHLILRSSPIGHASRATTQGRLVRRLPGVIDANVSIEGMVRVDFDRSRTDEAAVRDALGRIGIHQVGEATRRTARVSGPPDETRSDDLDHARDHSHGTGRVELGAAVVSAGIYLVARSLDWFTNIDRPVTAMYIAAALLTGFFVASDAFQSVKARIFDIDQLMLVAAIGAAAIGNWSDASLLLVLFSLGHALEGHAMSRARSAIESLGALAPATARRRSDPSTEVPLAELIVGDIVLIRPNERLPADGMIVAGITTIDESPVTGESAPVDKSASAERPTPERSLDTVPAAHRVFAGTLNGAGALDVLVLRRATDSTLARVIEMVAEAETQVSPSQRLTKRVVRIFVPAVLVLVALLLIIPPLAGESFTTSFARAMAVLVAASPCALAIATPSAVLAGIARSARSGILVKGGGPLEALGSVHSIAFDKTGTLTEGRPILTDVHALPGVDVTHLLVVAHATEQAIDHPIARAVSSGALDRLGPASITTASGIESVTGRGVIGAIGVSRVMVGNLALFEGVEIPDTVRHQVDELAANGRTTMVVREDDRFLGVLGVMDRARPEAARAIAALRRLGVDSIVMLSGDRQAVATAVGNEVGVDEAYGALMPADKVDRIDALAQRGGVAMVGDGVNDAPALAAANVGIAMGAAGSDVALETADIALMADRLDQLPLAVGISRAASRKIKQNLMFSLGVVAVLIPLTLGGVGISAAVIAHEGSTLVVVANALLLLRYQPRRAAASDQQSSADVRIGA